MLVLCVYMHDDPFTLVLGGNFFGHDSAIFAILPKSEKIFAIQTERLTRYKHDGLYPASTIERLASMPDFTPDKIEKVVFCQMSLGPKAFRHPANAIKRETEFRKHLGVTYKKDVDARRLAYANMSRMQKVIDCIRNRHGWYLLYDLFATRLGLIGDVSSEELITEYLHNYFPSASVEVRYYDHEYCHAVCTAITSPFKEALLFSIDGWGDEYFSRVFSLKNGRIDVVANSPTRESLPVGKRTIPYSIGAIYSFFTEMLGFAPDSDEGKVEALAAYGTPLPALQALVNSVSFENLAINLDSKIGVILETMPWQYKENCAATVQKFLEIVSERYLQLIVEKTGIKNIALAGGVAANVINNLNILEKVAEQIHITPAMADDGGAQGAAYAYLLESGTTVSEIRKMTPEMPYFATSCTKESVIEALTKYGNRLDVKDLGNDWPIRTAELLANGKIGAIFHGKMEWGPRALGNRSIIADARRKDFRDKINKEIKRRPLFQPFCPSMLAEEKDRLFEKAYLNKHMTCAFRMKKEFWDTLPTAIHVDGTARVQFVEESDNPNYFRLLKKVKELTGFGVVINTSFNKHGRTIVESPDDAITDFLDTDMDYVVIEGLLVTKAVQKVA